MVGGLPACCDLWGHWGLDQGSGSCLYFWAGHNLVGGTHGCWARLAPGALVKGLVSQVSSPLHSSPSPPTPTEAAWRSIVHPPPLSHTCTELHMTHRAWHVCAQTHVCNCFHTQSASVSALAELCFLVTGLACFEVNYSKSSQGRAQAWLAPLPPQSQNMLGQTPSGSPCPIPKCGFWSGGVQWGGNLVSTQLYLPQLPKLFKHPLASSFFKAQIP